MNSNLPLLIVFQGSPATGKSYYSKKIEKILNIPRVDRDEIKSKLIKQYTTPKDPFCNQLKYKLLATNIFLEKVQNLLDKKQYVIIDGLIPKNEILDLFYKKFLINKYKIIEIKMYCSDNKLWRTRYNDRKTKPNQSSKNFDQIINLEKQYVILHCNGRIKIDSHESEKSNLEKIKNFILKEK
jgi:adenylate kinase family enzyme